MDLSHGDGRLIVAACKKHGLLRNQCAYVLATAHHETAGTMKPVRETLASSDAKAKELLTKAWKAGKMRWVTRDYWSSGFFGRGYVQLTHKENYQKAGEKLGIDLVWNPSKALEPDIAAEILVQGMRDGWFTGKKLSDYITLTKSDYVGARRIVNGTDRSDLITGYAKTFNALLMAEGYGVEPQSPPAEVAPQDDTSSIAAPAPRNGLWAAILSIILKLFGKGA